MNNDFYYWLQQNGLTEEFTTNAGDSFYTNQAKGFGVIKKHEPHTVQSFYLRDIVELKTYDDENLICEWNNMSHWMSYPKSSKFSTNEVYIKIRFSNQTVIKLQIFRGINGNVKRDSENHINLLNYACQISQILYNAILGINA